MTNRKNILKIGLILGVAVISFVALFSFHKANAIICDTCDPGGGGGGGGTSQTVTPTLNQADAYSSTGAYLSWTNNDGGAGTYYIYRSTDNVTFTFIASTTALQYYDSSNFIPTPTCDGNSTYYYRINEEVAGKTNSAYSNVIGAVFMCPPVITSVTAVSQTQLTISFVDHSFVEDGFTVYAGDVGSGAFIGFLSSSTGSGATIPFVVTGGYCGATQNYYIKTYTDKGDRNYSTAVSGVFAPCAPVSGSASAVSQTQITASWVLNGTWVGAYQIYRGGDLVLNTQTINANSTGVSFQDSGLHCGTTYSYLLRLWGGGVPTDSPLINGTTSACSAPAPMSTPTVTPTSGSPSAITNWSATADGLSIYLQGPSGYILAYNGSPSGSTTFGSLRCPYPYKAFYVPYNTDQTVSGTDVSCTNALSNAGISGPAAPTGARCGAAITAPINIRFCTQQFLGN